MKNIQNIYDSKFNKIKLSFLKILPQREIVKYLNSDNLIRSENAFYRNSL